MERRPAQDTARYIDIVAVRVNLAYKSSVRRKGRGKFVNASAAGPKVAWFVHGLYDGSSVLQCKSVILNAFQYL